MAKGSKVGKVVKPPKSQGSEGESAKKNGFLFTLGALLVALTLIVAIFGGVFFIAVKNNVNGIAEKYRKEISGIPIIKWALPEIPNPDDPKYLTDDEVRNRYNVLRKQKDEFQQQLDEAKAQIEDLQAYKSEQEAAKAANEQAQKDLETKKAELEKGQKQLEQNKQMLAESAVNKDKAAFREFFEQLDAERAKTLYSQIVKEQAIAEDVKNFIKTYEAMDAAAAAKIFKEMGEKKIDLIVEILMGIKKEISAEILAAMDSKLSAAVTEKMLEAAKQAAVQ